MTKFYLASFITCFFVLNSFAQKQNVYFLKDDGRYVDKKDSADYIRVLSEPDSGSKLYNVIEYYKNGNKKLIGKSSTIDPIYLEGMAINYYPNKFKKRVANYSHAGVSGVVYDYYPNGKMYRAVTFEPSTEKPISKPKESVQTVYDSTGTKTVENGNGPYQVFNSDFSLVLEEGEVKDGKRNGTWKGTSKNGKSKFTEEYADGKFLKGSNSDENGKTINYTVKEALPTFKGGESAYGRYLSQSVRYPVSAKDRNIQGKVIIGFVVEKDGSITEVKILKSVDPSLDNEAIRVIQQSPKWNPGLQNGVPVRVGYTMPLAFSLQSF